MKLWKKVAALALMGVLAVSLVACDSASASSWVAKNSNLTVTPGVYRYYLTSAYASAYNERSDYSASPLDQEIEGKNGAEWVRNQGLQSVKNLMLINDLMKEYKLTLSDEDNLEILSRLQETWDKDEIRTEMEKYGISKEDLKTAVYDFSAQNTTVFEYLYTKGDKAIPDEELQAYFKENYTGFRYVLQSTYENYASLPDDQLTALRTQFQGYADAITAGTMTLQDAAKELAEQQLAKEQASAGTESGVSSETSSDTSIEKQVEKILQVRALNLKSEQVASSYPSAMITALEEMKAGEVRTLETDGYLITMMKDDIDESAKETLGSREGKREILIDWKGAEYTEQMTERAESYTNYQLNDEEYQVDLVALFEPDHATSDASSGEVSSGEVSSTVSSGEVTSDGVSEPTGSETKAPASSAVEDTSENTVSSAASEPVSEVSEIPAASSASS